MVTQTQRNSISKAAIALLAAVLTNKIYAGTAVTITRDEEGSYENIKIGTSTATLSPEELSVFEKIRATHPLVEFNLKITDGKYQFDLWISEQS